MSDENDRFEELVLQMWRDPVARSRNKNFYRYRDDPTFRRALNLVRTLRALRHDLETYRSESTVDLRLLGDQIRLSVEIPSLELRRTVYLSSFEGHLIGLAVDRGGGE